MIWVVVARPRSAAIKAASNSSSVVGGQLGRRGDDALDFVGQFAVRFAEALFEFLKQTHGSTMDCGCWNGVTGGSVRD